MYVAGDSVIFKPQSVVRTRAPPPSRPLSLPGNWLQHPLLDVCRKTPPFFVLLGSVDEGGVYTYICVWSVAKEWPCRVYAKENFQSKQERVDLRDLIIASVPQWSAWGDPAVVE